MQYNHICEYLKENLTERRYRHTLGVAKTAVLLAKKFGENTDNAYAAGLLHDCAKELSMEEMLKLTEDITTDDLTKSSPALLHGAAGACLARKLYNINDEIFGAIFYHTTGKANMSLLEKIIYIADYIEPNRNFSGVEEVREKAFSNIDEGIIISCGNVIIHTVNSGKIIHPNTVEARNCLLQCNGRDAVYGKSCK